MNRKVCIIETRQEFTLQTTYDYPPIPFRNMDWSAINADTYDADWQGEEDGWKESGNHTTADTEIEAINELIELEIEDFQERKADVHQTR